MKKLFAFPMSKTRAISIGIVLIGVTAAVTYYFAKPKAESSNASGILFVKKNNPNKLIREEK